MKAKRTLCVFVLAVLLISTLTTTFYFDGAIFAESEIRSFNDVGENYSWAKDRLSIWLAKV